MLLSLSATVAVTISAAQAHPSTAAFVMTIGAGPIDTVAVERFVRTADTLYGVYHERNPFFGTWRFSGRYGPGGTLTDLRLENAGASEEVLRTITYRWDSDTSAVIHVDSAGQRRTINAALPAGTVPWFYYSVTFFEEMVRQAVRSGVDLYSARQTFPGSPGASPNYVKRGPGGTWATGYFGRDTIRFRAAADGAVTMLDMTGTTSRVTATRLSDLDIEPLIRDFSARQRARPMAVSPHARVTANLDSGVVSVTYGRPVRRGREIFGALVPWGEVWRTGANQASVFHTDRRLLIGGDTVPAGDYSLWTIPNRDGSATLVLNGQAATWGTNHNPELDRFRIPMSGDPRPDVLDTLTISLAAPAPDGWLTIEWERTRWRVPFRVIR